MSREFNLRPDQTARLNAVLDFIEIHLDEDLSLERLASVAAMSPFHFLRLFSDFMDETPNRYIRRIRMEKAAFLLLTRPEGTVLATALDCGYSSVPPFDRAFRARFGMPPTEWRSGGWKKSRIGQQVRNPGKDGSPAMLYYDEREKRHYWRMRDWKERLVPVRVMKLPDREVVYIRHRGAYQGDPDLFSELLGKLFRWAVPRGLTENPESRCLILYHDDPYLTEGDRLRFSVCLTVPSGTPVDGEVGRRTIPGGLYAAGLFRLNGSEYSAAWEMMTEQWLPVSGYIMDNRPSFEFFPETGGNNCGPERSVEITLPVCPA